MSDIAARPRRTEGLNPGAETLLFWEKGRVIYNAILILISVPFFGLSFYYAPIFLTLAILANVVYCVAYPVDLLMQQTTFAEGWLRIGRWLLLAAGTAFAAFLAISVTYGSMNFDFLNFTMD
jgi:hypothetical protein